MELDKSTTTIKLSKSTQQAMTNSTATVNTARIYECTKYPAHLIATGASAPKPDIMVVVSGHLPGIPAHRDILRKFVDIPYAGRTWEFINIPCVSVEYMLAHMYENKPPMLDWYAWTKTMALSQGYTIRSLHADLIEESWHRALDKLINFAHTSNDEELMRVAVLRLSRRDHDYYRTFGRMIETNAYYTMRRFWTKLCLSARSLLIMDNDFCLPGNCPLMGEFTCFVLGTDLSNLTTEDVRVILELTMIKESPILLHMFTALRQACARADRAGRADLFRPVK